MRRFRSEGFTNIVILIAANAVLAAIFAYGFSTVQHRADTTAQQG